MQLLLIELISIIVIELISLFFKRLINTKQNDF